MKNVIIARDYSLVAAPPVEISSIEISLVIQAVGAETVYKNKKFYDYQVVNKTKDKIYSSISIIDGNKEIFLDSRIFGEGLKIGEMDGNGDIKRNNDKIYVPEINFNRPLMVKVYYRDLVAIERSIRVVKELQTNVKYLH